MSGLTRIGDSRIYNLQPQQVVEFCRSARCEFLHEMDLSYACAVAAKIEEYRKNYLGVKPISDHPATLVSPKWDLEKGGWFGDEGSVFNLDAPDHQVLPVSGEVGEVPPPNKKNVTVIFMKGTLDNVYHSWYTAPVIRKFKLNERDRIWHLYTSEEDATDYAKHGLMLIDGRVWVNPKEEDTVKELKRRL